MFYLEVECKKCKAITEIYSEPNETIDMPKCPNCKCTSLYLMKAQSLDAKAITLALESLNERMTEIEQILLEEGLRQAENIE